jgi:hypothetical protein
MKLSNPPNGIATDLLWYIRTEGGFYKGICCVHKLFFRGIIGKLKDAQFWMRVSNIRWHLRKPTSNKWCLYSRNKKIKMKPHCQVNRNLPIAIGEIYNLFYQNECKEIQAIISQYCLQSSGWEFQPSVAFT